MPKSKPKRKPGVEVMSRERQFFIFVCSVLEKYKDYSPLHRVNVGKLILRKAIQILKKRELPDDPDFNQKAAEFLGSEPEGEKGE